MSNDDLEMKTREVFHEIHSGHLKNKDSLKRFTNLLTTENLKVPKNFFKDKICGDLGCGSAVNGMVNLLNLDSKYVHGLDLDKSFIPTAKNVLENEHSFKGRWHLDIGSLMDLPYDNQYFDFVLCQGVIHHTKDDMTALKQIFRVLKSEGKALITFGNKGGVANRFFKELLRDEYENNNSFSEFIDKKLTAKYLRGQMDFIIENMENDNSQAYKRCFLLLDCLRYLLDEDFILSVKDRIQAPKYKMYEKSEVEKMFKSAGFKSWYRIFRKPAYNNIRKIFLPLYINHSHELAKIFYGEGSLIYVVSK